MRKTNAIIFGSLTLATILGIFGQGLAYFLNENFAKVAPVYYLTVLTILSVFLFFGSFVLTYLQHKKQRIKRVGVYYPVIFIIGWFTSCWSLFVLTMWWG